MSKIINKFSNLVEKKLIKLVNEYQKLISDKYPILKCNNDKKLYTELESNFSKENVDLKMEYYDIDCLYQLLNHMIKKEVYYPYFDILISFKDLGFLEKLMEENELSIEEKIVILKFYFKHILEFYRIDNIKFYNMALAARSEAKRKYTNGEHYENLLIETLIWLQDSNMGIASKEFLDKVKVCNILRKITSEKGIEEIFNYPEYLEKFGLSNKLLLSLKEIVESKNKQTKIISFSEMVEPKKIEEPKRDLESIKIKIQKYLLFEELRGIIENDDLKEFLTLAKMLYSKERVTLLKEKVLLNNKLLKEEKRRRILTKIIHSDNLDYYDYLNSLDLNDPNIFSYSPYIKNTIETIERFVTDLVNDLEEELILLYLEETSLLLDNMKACLGDLRR